MSRENVEVVQRVYEAVARRDTASVLSFYDPGVEWDTSRSPTGTLMGPRVFRGHEGLRQVFREWHEAWENLEGNVEELIDAGDHVIAVGTARGRGRASGVEVGFGIALVWTLREGKVTRVVWFPTRDEALDAVGLGE